MVSNCNFKQRLKGFISIWWSLFDCLHTSEIFILYWFYKFVCESSADNQATIKLLYIVETKLTSILSCSEGSNSLSWNSKYWISEMRHNFYTFIWESSVNKQQIQLRYNDVKNSTSIMIWCNGDKVVYWKIEKLHFYLKITFNAPPLKYHPQSSYQGSRSL